MATLAGKTIADTYTSLLKLEGDTQTLVAKASGNAIQVKTGDDEATPLYLNTDAVGIGTNTPAKSLVVAGSGQQEIHVDAATNANILLDAGGNSDTSKVIFQKAGSTVGAIQYNHHATATSESLRIVVNESGSVDPQMVVQADGNVGIGTVSPTHLLEIEGAHGVASLSAENGMIFIGDGDTGIEIGRDTNSPYGMWFQGKKISDNTDRPIILNPAGDSVGIGTTSPNYKLEVEDTNTNSGGAISLCNNDADVDSGNVLGQVQFRGLDGVTTGATGAKILGIAEAQWGVASNTNDAPSSLRFYTQSDGDGANALLAPAMTIDENQNIGIGTTNPLHRFVIKSSTSGASDVPSYIALEDDDAVLHGFIGTCWNVDGGADPGYHFLHMGSSYYTGTNWITNYGTTYGSNNVCQIIQDTAGIRFLTENSTGNSQRTDSVATFDGYERMRIDVDTGRVGIGTTSPGTLLEVKESSTNAAGFVNSNWDTSAETGSRLLIHRGATSGDTWHGLQAQDQGDESNNNLILQKFGGNVGIGTDSPSHELTVSASSENNPTIAIINESTSDQIGGNLFFINSHTDGTIASGRVLGDIVWQVTNNADGDALQNAAAIKVVAGDTIGEATSDSPGEIQFHTTPNTSESMDQRMTIKSTGNIGIRTAAPVASVSMSSGKHIIAVDQIIRYAHNGDNSVIVKVPDVKIPAYAIITRVVAVVAVDSNLATHNVNIQMSATDDTAADSTISSGTELLGAGAGADATSASTDEALGATRTDIHMDAGEDEKNVWLSDALIRNNSSSDQYIYVCNAGTGNGTTNSTEGTLSIIVEYYGAD